MFPQTVSLGMGGEPHVPPDCNSKGEVEGVKVEGCVCGDQDGEMQVTSPLSAQFPPLHKEGIKIVLISQEVVRTQWDEPWLAIGRSYTILMS